MPGPMSVVTRTRSPPTREARSPTWPVVATTCRRPSAVPSPPLLPQAPISESASRAAANPQFAILILAPPRAD